MAKTPTSSIPAPTDNRKPGPWVVLLEPGVWLAPWMGDPGRTTARPNAKEFSSEVDGIAALGQARLFRPFERGQIIAVEPPTSRRYRIMVEVVVSLEPEDVPDPFEGDSEDRTWAWDIVTSVGGSGWDSDLKPEFEAVEVELAEEDE